MIILRSLRYAAARHAAGHYHRCQVLAALKIRTALGGGGSMAIGGVRHFLYFHTRARARAVRYWESFSSEADQLFRVFRVAFILK